jgi:hypothetical protein
MRKPCGINQRRIKLDNFSFKTLSSNTNDKSNVSLEAQTLRADLQNCLQIFVPEMCHGMLRIRNHLENWTASRKQPAK